MAAAITRWAVSNDQITWSAWQQDGTTLKWRLNQGENGRQVFIKYQTGDTYVIHYQVAVILLAPDSSPAVEAAPAV